jgi:hypothetical protein
MTATLQPCSKVLLNDTKSANTALFSAVPVGINYPQAKRIHSLLLSLHDNLHILNNVIEELDCFLKKTEDTQDKEIFVCKTGGK